MAGTRRRSLFRGFVATYLPLVAVVLVATLGTAGTALASGGKPAVFKANGGPAQVKPETLYASPTSGPFAKRLSWSGWGSPTAYGEGTVYYDTCEPDCEDGYHPTSGEVIFSGLHRCGRTYHYLKLRFVYYPAPEYDARASYNCGGVNQSFHVGR